MASRDSIEALHGGVALEGAIDLTTKVEMVSLTKIEKIEVREEDSEV